VDDHNVLDPVDQLLAWLKEELGITAADLGLAVLGLTGLVINGVSDDAELVKGQNDDLLLLEQLLSRIDDVDVLDGLIHQPLLPGAALVSIEVSEILQGANVQGSEIVQHKSLSDVTDLNLGCRHEVSGLAVKPLP
jgi:hypothetical protein